MNLYWGDGSTIHNGDDIILIKTNSTGKGIAMFNYAEMTTAELIELLFKEEDRVTLEHIQALAERGDAAVPRLREILFNEDYWYEGQRAEFWAPLHTVVSLSLMRDPQLLPDLLSIVMHSYFADQHWVTERWPELLAEFGEPAVEPLINFILEHRGYHRDNIDYSFARNQMARALTRIALENEEVRPRVSDFLIGLLRDSEETDRVFLTQMLICPPALDRKRGLQAAQGAFSRGRVGESVWGKYQDFVNYVNDRHFDPMNEFGDDFLDFYEPEAIAERQKRWAAGGVEIHDEDDENDGPHYDRAWSGPAPFPLPMSRLYAEPDPPKGQPATAAAKVGRNDPCPCGSGKKYKKCHGQ